MDEPAQGNKRFGLEEEGMQSLKDTSANEDN